MSRLQNQVLSGEAVGTPLKDLGLRGRGVVFIGDSEMIQFISRSSRVLRKDAERFVAILKHVSEIKKAPLNGILLVRTAPICSKAKSWLEERGVHLEQIND